MKLHGDPSITYRINAGSLSAVSAPSLAHSVTTYRGSGDGQFATDTLSFTTSKEDVLLYNTSKEKWHARAILPMATTSKSAHNTNFKMAQRFQHGIPDVVLMVLKGSPQTRMWKK